MTTHYKSVVSLLTNALDSNPECVTGLMISKRVYAIDNGPSGGPEVIVPIYTDERHASRFWYGHIKKHPENNKVFVALLVWSTQLINARTVPLLFERFHYWHMGRGCYMPCGIQDTDDAYAERRTFYGAVEALAYIISRFNIDKRSGEDDSEYVHDQSEMRIMNVFGFMGFITKDEDGSQIGPPTLSSLKLVKNDL